MYKTGKWTSSEEQTLKTLGPTKTCKELVDILNRSSSSIYHHAKILNVEIKKETRDSEWTNDEIEKLKQLSSTHTSYQLSNILNRTEKSICDMANNLELQIKAKEANIIWTDEDINTLKKLINIKNIKEISCVLHRSENSVYRQALKLGLISPTWDDKKTEQLKNLVGQLPIKEIAIMMDCSISTINRKVKLIKEGKETVKSKKEPQKEKNIEVKSPNWSKQEIETIKILGQKYPCEIIADILKREKKEIYYISEKKNIYIKSRYEYLKELISDYIKFNPNFTIEEIAEMFHKSNRRITDILKEMGIKYESPRMWSVEEQEYLEQQWGTKSIKKISKVTGRSITAVRTKAGRLNLGPMLENNEKIPISMIVEILNVNKNTVTKCWTKHGLKINRIHLTTNTTNLVVSMENLYNFLENNQDKWNSINLEKNILGIEPEWMKLKRKLDVLDISGKPLSIKEMEQLKTLLLQNKSLSEISQLLKRNINDITTIMNELLFNGNIKYFCTQEEITILKRKKLSL